MDNETNPNIFELRINETGKKYIHSFYSLGTLILVLNIILSVIFIGTEIYNITRLSSETNLAKNFYPFIFPVYSIVYTVFAFLGVYYYVLFSKKIKASIANYNESGLNLSFKYLYLNALIFLISMILTVVFSFYNVFSIFLRSSV